jgi:hypothetical protein
MTYTVVLLPEAIGHIEKYEKKINEYYIQNFHYPVFTYLHSGILCAIGEQNTERCIA